MKPITIVGGGLAGLSLGIGLRKRGVPVTIYEAGHYPRHRVCGEFVSGDGQRVLMELGIAGAQARTAAFFTAPDRCWRFDLPEPAVCVSRYALDKKLADAFCAFGGKLVCGTRVQSMQEGAVRATGRRLHPVENGWRWFGLKAHVTGIELAAGLEMHLLPNGYVGICRLPDGQFNVCGLFRKQKAWKSDRSRRREEADGSWLRACPPPHVGGYEGVLTGAPGSSVRARLERAQWIEDSFVAVAGVCFCPPAQNGECHLGDAHAMIAPLTGNGMSMAFESAATAIDPLVTYAQGDASWPETVQQIGARLRQAFGWRLRWGNWLQATAFQPWLLSLGARAGLGKLLFAATR